MFNDNIKSQVIGTLKIFDKDSGEVLVQKRNAIHPGNMAYVIASALAGKPANINQDGAAPYINWMAFGNGGSNSTTTLSYRSPRVFGVYDELPITSSNSRLYAKTYQQQMDRENDIKVYFPGEEMDGVIVADNTSKIKFSVNMNHDAYATMVGETTPENDSTVSDPFTFDEIALLSGVTENDTLDEDKTLMLTHVTFHPVLLSANRTIVIDYTVTIQIN
ncbi:hypothetical protein N8344_00070 [bacterium]|nr:hypothetical protein [bacterium]